MDSNGQEWTRRTATEEWTATDRRCCFCCWAFITGFIFPGPLSLLIAGSVIIPVGTDRQNIANSADLEADFPAMANGMDPAGSCKVIRMWFRSVGHVFARRTVCYDEFIAEFAWTGGPSNTCKHCTEGRAQIQMMGDGNEGLIASRLDDLSKCRMLDAMPHGCAETTISVEHYGGWRAGAYHALPENGTRVAISQAWERSDGRGCTTTPRYGEWDPYRSSYNVEQEREMFSSTLTCRLPANGVDGVSEVYDCPDKRYNSLCARLGDLPLAEIDAYGSDGDGLVIAGAPARR